MKNQHALKFRLKKHWSTLLLLLPAVVLGVVCSYVPMVGILMAFKTNLNLYIYEPFTAFLNAEWTLENFQIIFAGEEFLGVLWNTLYISVLKIVVLFPLPIIVSLLLTEVKNIRVSRMCQSLMYLPHFLSWSIITGIFMSVFATDGLVNNVLILFGMDASEAVNWYTDPSKFVFLVLFTDGWKGIGWSSIVYIAAINAISPEYYEASRLDGAGKLSQIWYITLPLIKNVIVTMLIMRICYIMDAGFDQIYTMHNAATRPVWQIIGTYIYEKGLQQGNYSFSTAVGLFNSVVALIMILVGNFVAKKISGKGVI